jgi:hypothetical protein
MPYKKRTNVRFASFGSPLSIFLMESVCHLSLVCRYLNEIIDFWFSSRNEMNYFDDMSAIQFCCIGDKKRGDPHKGELRL